MLNRDSAGAHRTFEIADVCGLYIKMDRKIGLDLIAGDFVPSTPIGKIDGGAVTLPVFAVDDFVVGLIRIEFINVVRAARLGCAGELRRSRRFGACGH